MSSDNPPYPYYDGIPFNPSFFTSTTDTSSGLTETKANNLYLRKTVADTATAQETFALGIKAQKVDGLLSSSIMYVGNNITSGSLILGNTGIRTKNQGILEAYSIRTPATNGQLAICTDLTTGGSVEIGSVNGTVNLLGSAAGGVNVPTSSGVTTNAVNVAYLTSQLTTVARLNQVQIFAQTNTFNGGINVVGTTNINTSGTATTTIGNVSNILTNNGSIIKNIVPCLGGGNIETVIGNANNLLSLSTTFNRKFTTSLVALPCFSIVSPGNYATQYFEIVISGANNNRGGYTYKGCFGMQTGGGVTVSAVTQLFFYGSGVAPVITFGIALLTVTISINCSAASSDQCFVSTITSYPSLQLDNGSSDFSITAI